MRKSSPKNALSTKQLQVNCQNLSRNYQVKNLKKTLDFYQNSVRFGLHCTRDAKIIT